MQRTVCSMNWNPKMSSTRKYIEHIGNVLNILMLCITKFTCGVITGMKLGNLCIILWIQIYRFTSLICLFVQHKYTYSTRQGYIIISTHMHLDCEANCAQIVHKQSILYIEAQVWNCIDNNIKCNPCFKIFGSKFRKQVLELRGDNNTPLNYHYNE